MSRLRRQTRKGQREPFIPALVFQGRDREVRGRWGLARPHRASEQGQAGGPRVLITCEQLLFESPFTKRGRKVSTSVTPPGEEERPTDVRSAQGVLF